MSRSVRTLFLMLVLFCAFSVEMLNAIPVADPKQIEVIGLLSRGEDGSAWIKAAGHTLLVEPGYMIGRDLRVVAIRKEGVVLYRPQAKEYISLAPELSTPLPKKKNAPDIIYSLPMPVWRAVRMTASAYDKDYVCHWQTSRETAPHGVAHDMSEMLKIVLQPDHRWYGIDGVICEAPAAVHGPAWRIFISKFRAYDASALSKWFPTLAGKGSLISDGQDIKRVLAKISRESKAPIIWRGSRKIPVYCSLKDRPWYEILKYVAIYNGLNIIPSAQGLTVTDAAQ